MQGVDVAKKQSAQSFRFYDNRQKYLAFVHTCNEKAVVAGRVGQELEMVRPTPPALYFFDAGMGDGTVLSRLMRHAHAVHPTVPMVAVAKEISLEDVRLGLEKMPDRFTEHPATVLVITNLNYSDAPRLLLRDTQLAAALNWQEIRLTGHSSHAYEEQIEEVSNTLADAWATHPSEKTGNPVYRRPSVLVVYREDHKFLLDSVIPRPGRPPPHYDLILASQPWRARMSAEFKASRVLAPLARALAPGGRLLMVTRERAWKRWRDKIAAREGESAAAAYIGEVLRGLEQKRLAPPSREAARFHAFLQTAARLRMQRADRYDSAEAFEALLASNGFILDSSTETGQLRPEFAALPAAERPRVGVIAVARPRRHDPR